MSFPWLARVDTHSALRVNWRLAFQDLGLALALGDNELGGCFLEEGRVVSSLQKAPPAPPQCEGHCLAIYPGPGGGAGDHFTPLSISTATCLAPVRICVCDSLI